MSMTQTNVATRRERSIRRVGLDHSVRLTSLRAMVGTWHVKTDHGWAAYEQSVQIELDAQPYNPSINRALLFHPIRITTNGQQYTIDLVAMRQRNEATGM